MEKQRKRKIIQMEGYEMIEKTVVEQGNSGRVYVPKLWAGKKVAIILVE